MVIVPCKAIIVVSPFSNHSEVGDIYEYSKNDNAYIFQRGNVKDAVWSDYVDELFSLGKVARYTPDMQINSLVGELNEYIKKYKQEITECEDSECDYWYNQTLNVLLHLKSFIKEDE